MDEHSSEKLNNYENQPKNLLIIKKIDLEEEKKKRKSMNQNKLKIFLRELKLINFFIFKKNSNVEFKIKNYLKIFVIYSRNDCTTTMKSFINDCC